jgi:trehalose synthase
VDDTEQCAERVLFLLKNREEARKRGLAGRERVRQRFLITRLLADELRLLASLPREAESPVAASPSSVTAGSLLVSSD